MTDNSSEKNARRLFVCNLHPSTTEGDLIKLFRGYGNLTKVDYMWHKSGENRGKPKGFAFIDYDSEVFAKKAFDAGNRPNKIVARGRILTVKYSDVEKLTSNDTSNPYAASSVPFGETSQGGKRGRDPESTTEEDSKKLRNIRMIEEKMRKLEETLKKIA